MRALSWAAALAVLISTLAEAASPNVTNLLPRGAQRGTEAEIRFVGASLHDAVDLLFHQPGIAFVQEVRKSANEFVCTVSIAPDAAVGRHAIRVRTATGLSNPFIFSVGALPEIQEAEPNGDAKSAQPIQLGTTVNGVIVNEDVDEFSVSLAEGDRLSVEVEGIRLGHKLFDPKLRLFSPDGHELIAEDDTAALRQDAAFVHTAEKAGTYRVAVSEASYGGSSEFEYRLHVGNFPRPLGVTPMGGAPDQTLALRWLGDPALGTGDVTSTSSRHDVGAVHAVSELGVAPTPLPFRVSSLATTLEAEPNNDPDGATPFAVPGAFEGVIERAGDFDWASFEGRKDQVVTLRVWARDLGSPLDSVLTLRAPDGKQILWNDDADTQDSGGRVTLPADGRYTVSVRDHLRNGGPTYAYRLEVDAETPVLSLAPVGNEKAVVAVPQNNTAFGLFSVNRKRFNGPVELSFDGLPEGVTVSYPPIAPGQSRVPVLFTASADVPPQGALLPCAAVGKNGEAEVHGGIDHTIRLVLGANETVFDALHVDRLAFAVTNPAPFSLVVEPPKAGIPRRGKCRVAVRAVRSEGFTAPINIRAPWAPKGIGIPSGQIKEGETETTIPLEVKPDAVVGENLLVVVGQSSGFEVSTPLTPFHVEDVWLALDVAETQAELGQSIEWVAAFRANRELPGSVYIDAAGYPAGIQVQPLDVAPATADLRFPVAVAADAPEGKHGPVGFRARVVIDGEEVIMGLGSAHLKVFKPLPPALAKPAPAPTSTPTPKPNEPEKRRTRFPSGP